MMDKFTCVLRMKGPGGHSIFFSLNQSLDPYVAMLVLAHSSFEFFNAITTEMGNPSKEFGPFNSGQVKSS